MIPEVKIVDAELKHIEQMDGNFDPVNIEECWAFARITPLDALKMELDIAAVKKVILVGEEPVACFGVNRRQENPQLGTTWMLVTKNFKEYGARLIVREAKPHLLEMLKDFYIIEAWTYKKNKPTIRWLKWCGFEERAEYDIGVDNATFLNFRLCKDKLNGT